LVYVGEYGDVVCDVVPVAGGIDGGGEDQVVGGAQSGGVSAAHAAEADDGDSGGHAAVRVRGRCEAAGVKGGAMTSSPGPVPAAGGDGRRAVVGV
jgi:hypothetical protein